jgi:hypothetical protein
MKSTCSDCVFILFHGEFIDECQFYFPARRGLDRVEAVDVHITGIVHSVVVGEVERLDRPTGSRQRRTSPASCATNRKLRK